MATTNTDGAFSLRWLMPVILIFLAGGFLQYLGLLSQTQTNWFALLLLGHIFLLRSSWKQIRHESLLIVFLAFVGAAHFLHSTPITYTATYFYYITCTILAAVAGRIYAQRAETALSTVAYFRLAKSFLLLELAITGIQALFTEQFISSAREPIGYVDAVFGTFFLQSDAALAAVCELLTISAFFLPCKTRDRLKIPTLSLGVVFLGNSNTAKFTITLLLLLLCGNAAYKRLGFGRHGFTVLISIALLGCFFAMYSPLSGLANDFLVRAMEDYDHREAWETASRFAPLGQIYAEGINFFGQGALTYYNPITKEWLYNSGFSILYSLYLDYGLFGLLLYCIYQITLILKLTKGLAEFTAFLLVLVSFSMFNFALTDLAFNFSFNAILYLNHLHRKSESLTFGNPNSQQEPLQWT